MQGITILSWTIYYCIFFYKSNLWGVCIPSVPPCARLYLSWSFQIPLCVDLGKRCVPLCALSFQISPIFFSVTSCHFKFLVISEYANIRASVLVVRRLVVVHCLPWCSVKESTICPMSVSLFCHPENNEWPKETRPFLGVWSLVTLLYPKWFWTH